MRCRLCKKPIEAGAIKCTECDGYQNWRRYFDFSSVILSLLIALFSVLTITIPVLTSVFTQQNSDVQLTVLGHDENTITVVCSNRGNRTTVVYRITLLPTASPQGTPPGWDLPLPDGKIILHPGDVQVLKLLPHIGETPVDFPKAAQKIELRLIPFRSERDTISRDLDK